MGIMDKIKKMAGTGDQYNDFEDDYYNEFDTYDDPEDADILQTSSQTNQGMSGGMQTQSSYSSQSSGYGMQGGFSAGAGISLAGSAIELKVVKPQRFESVPQIADHLLNKRTVVLNLEDTNKETARRLIDFLSGVAYSIDGNMKKIATNAYVITPNNVDVSGEQLRDRKAAQQQQQEPVDEYSDI